MANGDDVPIVETAAPTAPAPIEQKPFVWTPVLQMLIAASSLCVAAAAISFTVKNFTDSRNAQLVQIGIDVLKVTPDEKTQIQAAREWAMDLIDANSGVRFSEKARRQLLEKPLVLTPTATNGIRG